MNSNLDKLRELTAKLSSNNDDYINRVVLLTTDIIVVINNECFVAVNPAWTKVLGWNPDETLGKPWTDFVHPDDIESSKKAAADRDNPPDEIINRYRTSTGKYVKLCWGRLCRDSDGHVYAIARVAKKF